MFCYNSLSSCFNVININIRFNLWKCRCVFGLLSSRLDIPSTRPFHPVNVVGRFQAYAGNGTERPWNAPPSPTPGLSRKLQGYLRNAGRSPLHDSPGVSVGYLTLSILINHLNQPEITMVIIPFPMTISTQVIPGHFSWESPVEMDRN